MSDRSKENVPRGDHVPRGCSEDTESRGNLDRAEPGVDGAGERGHGAHGERSGGSIIDKREPDTE